MLADLGGAVTLRCSTRCLRWRLTSDSLQTSVRRQHSLADLTDAVTLGGSWWYLRWRLVNARMLQLSCVSMRHQLTFSSMNVSFSSTTPALDSLKI